MTAVRVTLTLYMVITLTYGLSQLTPRQRPQQTSQIQHPGELLMNSLEALIYTEDSPKSPTSERPVSAVYDGKFGGQSEKVYILIYRPLYISQNNIYMCRPLGYKRVYLPLCKVTYTLLYPRGVYGCICHFTKWQLHPFISKGTMCSWNPL